MLMMLLIYSSGLDLVEGSAIASGDGFDAGLEDEESVI